MAQRECTGGGFVLPSLSNSANIEATCDVMVQYTLNIILLCVFLDVGVTKQQGSIGFIEFILNLIHAYTIANVNVLRIASCIFRKLFL